MSRQDRAITERHTKILRELVKRPENKTCSDCKHNDPRWASWNLGVFLCIRCSGIHRGMGTHISKVKSIDLDTWTPEQMESITKWGNRRANLYWEAHLKSGHVPPDHKMESFIRSKYESRRWAMDGPPPSDPAILDSGAPAPTVDPPAPTAPQASAPRSSSSSSSARARPPVTARQPQAHQLLSTQHARAASTARSVPASAPAPPQPTPPPPQPTAPENDLFSLDFHAPAPSSFSSSSSSASSAPRKDVKQDILSLFSTPAHAAPQPPSAFGTFTSAQSPTAHAPSPWAATGRGAGYAQPAAPASAAQAGGNWGVGYGWNAAPAAHATGDIWGAQPSSTTTATQQQLFNTADIWGGSASASASVGGNAGGDVFGAPAAAAQQKDDVFGDLWGGFK